MALSLNDPKLKRRLTTSNQKPGLPPKNAGMPWRGRAILKNDDSEPNQVQTGHKLGKTATDILASSPNQAGPIVSGNLENPQQTYNKATTELTTNLQQTYSGESHLFSETYNKLPTQPTTLSTTNLQQTDNKLTTNSSFLTLVGLQRKIVAHIYYLCKKLGSRRTGPITIKSIADCCETTDRSAQETINRLRSKSFLKRSEFKNGRGGWTIYELPDFVYSELFTLETHNKLTTNIQQTYNKLPTQLTTQPTTSLPSSSSYINNDFKPTTAEVARARMDVWAIEDLDYSMLSEIGFGRSQAMQLRSLELSFDVVQRSLVYFEFELRYTESGKSIKEPLALFMKRMRQNGCWEAPEEYQKRVEHFKSRFDEREKQLQANAIIPQTALLHEGVSI